MYLRNILLARLSTNKKTFFSSITNLEYFFTQVKIAFTLHGQAMSYLIGAVTIIHEAGVISAILPVKINNLQGSIRMEGHSGRRFDDLTPLLPGNRGFRLAHALAR